MGVTSCGPIGVLGVPMDIDAACRKLQYVRTRMLPINNATVHVQLLFGQSNAGLQTPSHRGQAAGLIHPPAEGAGWNTRETGREREMDQLQRCATSAQRLRMAYAYICIWQLQVNILTLPHHSHPSLPACTRSFIQSQDLQLVNSSPGSSTGARARVCFESDRARANHIVCIHTIHISLSFNSRAGH